MCFCFLLNKRVLVWQRWKQWRQNAVISSNAGGIPEVNIQGETGFLTEVGDVETMAKKTINLLQDDALLQK